MSRLYGPIVTATEANKSELHSEVPTKGTWQVVYGKDQMTPMGYFVDFVPQDDIARDMCSVNYNGQEDPEDEPLPKDQWEYNPISIDQMFTEPRLTTVEWMGILHSFGVRNP